MPDGLPTVDATGVPMIPIINDPAGDAEGPVDVITVSAGSDGSSVVSMELEFSAATPVTRVAGYVFLDTDQDPSTGEPAEWWTGLPTQDVGMEYLVDLFGLQNADPVVYVLDLSTYEVVAEVPAVVGEHTVGFDLPLEALGDDDGFINTAMVLGTMDVPTDWAPNTGHGTITPFVDLPWLDASPASGSVPAGDQRAITLTLGGPSLVPGEYQGLLRAAHGRPEGAPADDPRGPDGDYAGRASALSPARWLTLTRDEPLAGATVLRWPPPGREATSR